LDALRDPGNLGTMLRTAGAAGVQAVLLSPDCADPYNPKVLRAGMGAHFRIPLATLDWPQIATICAPLRVYLADSAGGVRYDQADWSAPWALLIGSEAHGAGTQALDLAAARIFIPMSAATESVNAAMAASVILFEALRQRL
ncbi:MAG: RNA methyltransferase, partial [Anaerolineae bacterium]|nr:RNA methyltransferase [Anaerolineae bacterium]